MSVLSWQRWSRTALLAVAVALTLAFLPGADLLAPSRAAAAAAGSPLGNFESAWGVPGGIELRGWAIDPDTAAPVYVWVTLDGAGRHVYANRARPDVGAAFPGFGPNHGMSAVIPAGAGTHRVCATVSNVGRGAHTPLGCRTVTVRAGSPFGNLELVRLVPAGIEVRGWAIDPDTTSPVYLWVTVDGVGRHVHADRPRPDVQRVHPGYGLDHGAAATVAAGPGPHVVCVTVSNVGPGAHTPLGCRSLGFSSTVTTIDAGLADRMTPSSWRPGCPVPLSDLRYVTVTYKGFDGAAHTGELVVAASVASGVVGVFSRLYEVGFPLESVRLVDDFGGDDAASMAADNASAFNCRAITGGTGFSEHSFGTAIDVNPRENPYVRGSVVLPPSGAPFVSRPRRPGVIHDGDAVVQAFAAIGWSWGGTWSSPVDYQHFSRSGR
jgi:hypothetical protein